MALSLRLHLQIAAFAFFKALLLILRLWLRHTEMDTLEVPESSWASALSLEGLRTSAKGLLGTRHWSATHPTPRLSGDGLWG